jgi:hypothetical protein
MSAKETCYGAICAHRTGKFWEAPAIPDMHIFGKIFEDLAESSQGQTGYISAEQQTVWYEHLDKKVGYQQF